jgi:prepilin-type N-terminal cleavage/methylation domain-containing protein
MKQTAFTLIELLIVVAIIAILAAIAVPNFLEAQTRSKVSRAEADMRSVITALECYRVDHNNYPLDGNDFETFDIDWFDCKRIMALLTTPIPYLTSFCYDPFHINDAPGVPPPFVASPPPPFPYLYMTPNSYDEHKGRPMHYTLFCLGPDKDLDAIISDMVIYDPTNGTISDGDIIKSN